MHVVATAGHVDHGKSTLVRALTGQDPDRLEAERRRGLSIELGYCWTTLPGLAGGQDEGEVAFVDVPGHERFVTTMLAGVGPLPVAMLVVAADDPWMPQAAEHLAALDALRVRHGLLVVTRADLADPTAALARARQEIDATSLRGAPSVVVSGRTGAGLDELRRVLVEVLRAVPRPDAAAPVRMWVDRRIEVRGIGTVVTGTLPAGTVAPGDELTSVAGPVRIRRVEALGRERDAMCGVARVALDLGGRAPEGLRRGTPLVTPEAFLSTALVDVRVDGADELPRQPVLHVGSAHVGTRVHRLAAGLARVRLDRPLPLRYDDRLLLRDPGSRRVWGAVVLDPVPPRRRRDLTTHDGSPAAELRLRRIARLSVLRRAGVPLEPLPEGTLAEGDWLVAPDLVPDLRRRLGVLVADVDLAPAAAAHALGLPDAVLAAGLVAPPLAVRDGRITSGPRLSAAQRDAAASLLAGIEGFEAPEAGRLAACGLAPGDVVALHRAGALLRLDGRTVLRPGADERAVEVLRALPQPFTTSAARQALGTSRRVVLPLLAHLDRTGRTVRLADDRRRMR